MSYNPNFYNNFRSNATFHSNPPQFSVPPPPLPPPFFIPAIPPPQINDQEFVKSFEQKMLDKQISKQSENKLSISKVREELHTMIATLNELKSKEKLLTDNINTLSEQEWSSHMKQIKENKELINKILDRINGPYLDVLRRLIAKRASKRLRMKRVRQEIKKEKEEKRKELEERSRKIDENLQKIQDDITKAKQEQEAKLEADMVLRENSRKRSDAKRCIEKLEALVKLRRARQKTAKGRGETVSESETAIFNDKVEKLKAIWIRKQASYKLEEADLRAKLKVDSDELEACTNMTQREVVRNLQRWKKVMFGGVWPQVDFEGDVGRFVAVRSQWDKYITKCGTALPIGWVPPSKPIDDSITHYVADN